MNRRRALVPPRPTRRTKTTGTTVARPDRSGTSREGAATALQALLVDHLERAYRGPAWHGPALRAALRGLGPAAALWRPAAGRHCAWELLLHAAHRKFAARKTLTGQRLRFPRPGRAFPTLPAPANRAALRGDLRLLDDQHEELLAALRALDPARLADRRGRWRLVDLLLGIAAHDVYHAGQIRLLLRLRQPTATP